MPDEAEESGRDCFVLVEYMCSSSVWTNTYEALYNTEAHLVKIIKKKK